MAKKHMQSCSTSLVIKQCKSKQWHVITHLTGMGDVKRMKLPIVEKNVKQHTFPERA